MVTQIIRTRAANSKSSLTHRLDELKFFPLLDLLDEADVLQAGADEVPLLHLHRRVRLQANSVRHIHIRNTYFTYVTIGAFSNDND